MDQLQGNPESKPEKESKKTSKVWHYFKLLPKDNKNIIYVQCQIGNCNEKLTYHDSTSVMIKHLSATHPDQHAEYEKKSIAKSSQKQQTKLLSKEYKFQDLSKERSQAITKAIAGFIAEDMKPISLVESKAFRKLLNLLEPRYSIPKRESFATEHIPKLYQSEKEAVMQDIKNPESFSVTFDYWTSLSQKSFLTLTIHYVDVDFIMKQYVLKTMEVRESHSGVNTAKVIREILGEFGIKPNEKTQVWGISDAARNMKSTVKELKWKHLLCFAHALHNTVKCSINGDEVSNLVTKCRELIKHFRASYKASNLLKDMQSKLKIPELKLKLDVPTRWNTLFDMLRRLAKNQSPIITLSVDNKEIKALNLTMAEWETIGKIVEVLEPFYDMTTFLSTVKSPSISMLNPLITNIQQKLLMIRETDDNFVQSVKNEISKDFKERIKQYEDIQETLDIASFLDPRFKKLSFASSDKKQSIYDSVAKLCNKYEELFSEDELFQSLSFEEIETERLKKSKVKAEKLSQIFGLENSPQQTDDNKIQREIRNYILDQPISIDENPLLWWKNNDKRYRKLSIIARHILAIPATSVPSERVFSKAGQIINSKRSALNSKLADQLIFLACNKKKDV